MNQRERDREPAELCHGRKTKRADLIEQYRDGRRRIVVLEVKLEDESAYEHGALAGKHCQSLRVRRRQAGADRGKSRERLGGHQQLDVAFVCRQCRCVGEALGIGGISIRISAKL
ncbi:MAG: hypothetical protein AAF937_03910 [Planctomycetota bacterium]